MVPAPGPDALLEGATAFVDELMVGLVNARIYWMGHPRVVSPIERALRRLQALAGPPPGRPVRLGVVEDCLVFQERPLLGASLSASRLIRAIRERGSGGLEFDGEAAVEDLDALFAFLLERPEPGEGHRSANTRLAAAGCRHARFLPEYRVGETQRQGEVSEARSARPAPRPSRLSRMQVPGRLYQEIVDLLQGLMIKVLQGEAFGFDPARSFVDQILARLEGDAGEMMRLTRYERYDAFTFGHSIRVCVLAVNFARSLTTDRAFLNRIGVAALLHDIGKARVPFHILQTPGALGPEERLEMQKHPVLGAEILQEMEDPDPMAVAAAFGHHLTEDRQGYPRTLHHHRLSTVTRICKICDVYEALTAVRPYKDAMSPLLAYRVMLSMRNHFEPALLRRFIQVNGIYPAGTAVELSDGRMARVRRQTPVLERPVVRIEGDGGAPPSGPAGDLLDLSHPSEQGVTIRRSFAGSSIPEGAWLPGDATPSNR